MNPVNRYALAVFAGGAVALVAAVANMDPAIVLQPGFWALSLLIVAGELFPVTIRRRNIPEQVMASSTFSFALLLYAGPGAAMVALVVASFVADLRGQRRWTRILFNIGQYCISLAAAGLVLALAGHEIGAMAQPAISSADLWPLLPAWVAIFSLNHLLVGAVVALDQGKRLTPVIREDLPFQLLTSGVLLALAPVVVVVSARTLLLLPCLLVPVLALHHSTKQSVEAAERAQHDPLTGLPNRGRFQELLGWTLDSVTTGTAGALLTLDLDRFGEVNDTLGHRAGDQLLHLVAKRLAPFAGDEGTLARLGGDEFALLVPGLADDVAAMALAQSVLRTMNEPFQVDQFTLHIRPSLGLAMYPRDGEDTETLLRRADIAVHAAKLQRSGVEMYSPGADLHGRRRLQLANDLRAAVASGAVEVHFQPKADLRTNTVIGAEALARWTHPSLGRISPDEFIPLAERIGLIDKLTEHVLAVALEHCTRWRARGLPLHVAVNVSMQTIHDSTLPEMVRQGLDRWPIEPEHLHLEVTESTIMADHERATATLDALRDLGVQLAVDDFGTGYSSLAHLKHLPVTQLKIDKTFVQDMNHDEADAAIVRSAIQLGGSLGMTVVAEGVEQPEVWEALTALGCDQVQGYYLSRPLPPEELTAWLLTREPRDGVIPAFPRRQEASEERTEPAAGAAPTVTPLFKRSL